MTIHVLQRRDGSFTYEILKDGKVLIAGGGFSSAHAAVKEGRRVAENYGVAVPEATK